MITARTVDRFTCTDCGHTVYSLPPRVPPPTRCVTCDWLAEFVADPVEREQLRRQLHEPAAG